MTFVPSIMAINAMTIASASATIASNAARVGTTAAKKEDDMENELHNPAGEHPAPKRKIAKRRKRRAAPRVKAAPKAEPKAAPAAAAAAPKEFEGITQLECCFDCEPEKCAITGIGVCGHPYKGGLQSSLLSKPDVVRRYQAVRRILAHQVTDKKI